MRHFFLLYSLLHLLSKQQPISPNQMFWWNKFHFEISIMFSFGSPESFLFRTRKLPSNLDRVDELKYELQWNPIYVRIHCRQRYIVLYCRLLITGTGILWEFYCDCHVWYITGICIRYLYYFIRCILYYWLYWNEC